MSEGRDSHGKLSASVSVKYKVQALLVWNKQEAAVIMFDNAYILDRRDSWGGQVQYRFRHCRDVRRKCRNVVCGTGLLEEVDVSKHWERVQGERVQFVSVSGNRVIRLGSLMLGWSPGDQRHGYVYYYASDLRVRLLDRRTAAGLSLASAVADTK